MKPTVPKIKEDDGGLIFDDTIVNKPDTDESQLMCWLMIRLQVRM